MAPQLRPGLNPLISLNISLQLTENLLSFVSTGGLQSLLEAHDDSRNTFAFQEEKALTLACAHLQLGDAAENSLEPQPSPGKEMLVLGSSQTHSRSGF